MLVKALEGLVRRASRFAVELEPLEEEERNEKQQRS
jgi:hypothetical protein